MTGPRRRSPRVDPATAQRKAAKTSIPASPALPKAEGEGRDGERQVVLAAVMGAHGLRGEVRLKLFSDTLPSHRTLRAGARPLTLDSLRGDIARFAEIVDRAGAESLRGTELSVPRSALPPLAEGEYYHADLLDLPCVDTAGSALGVVVSVDNFGAGDVLEIERPDGRRFMVPMHADAVPSFDSEKLVVDPDFIVL